MKERGWPVFRRPIENMKPVWKERWNRKALEKRKAQIGSLAFARGFELVPITSETAPIKGWWFGLWDKLPKLSAIGIVVDPNNSLREESDFTAIGLLGVDWNYRVYLIELIREHYEFPGLMDAIKKFAAHAEERYKMRPYIGVEQTAYQKAIPLQLKRETKYPIFGINADKSKFIRASRFAVHAENGRVFLKGKGKTVHPEQQVAYDECVMFPASAHDDIVDMLGYGVEMMIGLARKGKAIVR
jgi:predicted phage terminase large subunit-like protein